MMKEPVAAEEQIEKQKEELCSLIEQTSKEQNYQNLLLLATDIIKEGSYIYYNEASKNMIMKAFGVENLSQGYFLPNIVSRKKQIMPIILDILERFYMKSVFTSHTYLIIIYMEMRPTAV